MPAGAAGSDRIGPARRGAQRVACYAHRVRPARPVKKDQLPRKDCVRCGRPFTWRKKWERDWDNVKYCSDRCRMGRPGKSAERTPDR